MGLYHMKVLKINLKEYALDNNQAESLFLEYYGQMLEGTHVNDLENGIIEIGFDNDEYYEPAVNALSCFKLKK